MPKIKFENGVTVEVEKVPTPEEVEEIAKQLNLQPVPKDTPEEKKGFWGSMWDSTKEMFGTVKEAGEQVWEDDSSFADKTYRPLLRTAGAAGKFVGDLFVETVKQIGELSEDLTGNKGTWKQVGEIATDQGSEWVNAYLKTKEGRVIANAFKTGSGWWTSLEQNYPKVAQDIKDGLFAADIVPVGKFVKPVAEGTGKILKGGKELVEEIRAPQLIIKAEKEIDELVGRITQGNEKQIAKAKEALKELDTTGVATFDDLSSLADNSISAIGRKQDELLDGVTDIYKIDDFTNRVGDVDQNFVKRAFEHLEELYTKTENYEKLAELKELRKLADTQGLTLKDVNSLARRYGSDMPSGFSKLGEPLTSVNRVANENVRTGLKKEVRDRLPDDTSKALDAQMSNLYTLKQTSEKMAMYAQRLQNKVKERGLMEKLARALGRGVDIATLGTARGFLTSFLPSNIGNKVMNSLDVENALKKNLIRVKNLEGRIDKLSDANAIAALKGIIEEFGKDQAGFAKIPYAGKAESINDLIKKGVQRLENAKKNGAGKREINKLENDLNRLYKERAELGKGKGEIPTTTSGTLTDDIIKAKAEGKSFEEFIDSQYVYHATAKDSLIDFKDKGISTEFQKKGQYGKGTYTAPTIEQTKGYGRPEEIIIRIKRSDLPDNFQEFTEQGWFQGNIDYDKLEWSKNDGKIWYDMLDNRTDTNKDLKQLWNNTKKYPELQPLGSNISTLTKYTVDFKDDYIVFRGEGRNVGDGKGFIPGGTSYSSHEEIAEIFGDKIKSINLKNKKILDLNVNELGEDLTQELAWINKMLINDPEEAVKLLKKEGYDGVRFDGSLEDPNISDSVSGDVYEYIIFPK